MSKEFTGLEGERIILIESKLSEIKEAIRHTKAELSAWEIEKRKLESELKEIRLNLKQEEEN
jgi:hypothetical protein